MKREWEREREKTTHELNERTKKNKEMKRRKTENIIEWINADEYYNEHTRNLYELEKESIKFLVQWNFHIRQ